MRVVYKRYSDGSVKVEQTDDDGNNPRPLRPNDVQSGDGGGARRVSTYVVISFDDNNQEKQRAIDALAELRDELREVRV